MISFEEVKKYLPYYLSSESQKELYQELKDFPSNLDKRIYTKLTFDTSIIYQGDGIKDMMMVNLPSSDVGKLPAMVLSNTCDLDLSNIRKSDIRIIYAPIFKLDNYKKMLLIKSYFNIVKIYEHINSIRNQQVSHIFYLPSGQGLNYDGIVLLDRINNFPRSMISQEFLGNNRLFTLSNYGLYLFLIKLSIHFTRVREGVDRIFNFTQKKGFLPTTHTWVI